MTPARRAALAALADALQDVLQGGSDQISTRGLARYLGRGKSTPTDRGSDPDRWPISDLLLLSDRYATIDSALRDLFSPAAPPADASASAERLASSLIRTMGEDIARLMGRLERDGLDAAELRDTDTDLANLQTLVTQARAAVRARRRAGA